MLNKDYLIKLNKEFEKGIVVNENSLDFALSSANKTKDWLKQLAYLIRAILIDHIFEEGNKRTASALIMSVLENQKIAFDPYKIDIIIVEIIKKNIININKIKMLIKNVIR